MWASTAAKAGSTGLTCGRLWADGRGSSLSWQPSHWPAQNENAIAAVSAIGKRLAASQVRFGETFVSNCCCVVTASNQEVQS